MTIPIDPGFDLRIARLFKVLEHAERIACGIAMRQARLCREPRARRFFALQATQEALHATVFHAAATLLAPRGRSLHTPAIAALDDYRQRLDDDLAAGNLAGSVVGLQVVLEGLGDVVLRRLNPELNRHGTRFAPWQKLILAQETSHHAFGCSWVSRSSSAAMPALAASARQYLDLGTRLLTAGDELFGYGLGTAAGYDAQLRATVPQMLITEQA